MRFIYITAHRPFLFNSCLSATRFSYWIRLMTSNGMQTTMLQSSIKNSFVCALGLLSQVDWSSSDKFVYCLSFHLFFFSSTNDTWRFLLIPTSINLIYQQEEEYLQAKEMRSNKLIEAITNKTEILISWKTPLIGVDKNKYWWSS